MILPVQSAPAAHCHLLNQLTLTKVILVVKLFIKCKVIVGQYGLKFRRLSYVVCTECFVNLILMHAFTTKLPKQKIVGFSSRMCLTSSVSG